MQQIVLAGQTGLEVRTILNENFTELYDSKITTIRGWGYQDFDAGVINSTTVTLTDNTNGTDITFDSTNVIAGTAFIVVAANNLQVPCTGTSTWLFSSKVSAFNVVADTVILSGVPHIGWGVLRIFYLYDYIGKIPTGNIVAPKFISSQVLDILNASFATDLDVASKQDALAFVEQTENKFLRDDNTFQIIEPPAGGYANNLYFDETPSDVIGYETLTYVPNVATIIETHTVNASEGNKALHTYLYPTGVSVTNFPSGLWAFNFYGKVSSTAGVTQLGVTYFARHIDNSETDLFTVWSQEINNTVDDWIKFNVTQPNFTVVTTDRMGARMLVRTTRVADVTISYTVGDGYGAFLNNPNKIRHSQLRDWNGDTNYLHATSAEHSTWNAKVDGSGTTNEIPYWVDANSLGTLPTVTYPSLTELSYIKGVTSSVQTQVAGRNTYHGVISRTTNPLPTNLTTPLFTLGATANNISYYYQGTFVNVTSDKTTILNDGTGSTTTSGLLVAGQHYKITTYVAGDDFSNIATVLEGTINTTGCVFTATNTTPTVWTQGSSVQRIGMPGLYFIYFNAALGTILSSITFPGIACTSNVIIATTSWNGTNYGLVNDERHGYNRGCEWHQWAHSTVGVRYNSGLTLTHNSGIGNAATFATTAGEIWDEDIKFTIGASSTFPTANAGRLLYQVGASAYNFVSATTTTPGYLGANAKPNYVNTTGYVLTEMTSAVNRYINVFVYATTDNHTPIYFLTESVSSTVAAANGYTSLANARAVPFPNLSGYGLSPEMKPIYRLIWRADGVLQAISTTQDDYRTVSSLPMAAGNTSTTASAVTFNPSGNIEAVTVQTAIEELDSEKSSTSHYHTESFVIACSDETTALTASTSVAKTSFRMPYAFTITEVSASVVTAPTGSTLIVDIHDAGTSIMTTNKISIESGEYTSLDATTQPTLTDTALAKDSIITVFCDQIGSTIAGAGLKVIIAGHQ